MVYRNVGLSGGISGVDTACEASESFQKSLAFLAKNKLKCPQMSQKQEHPPDLALNESWAFFIPFA